MSFPTTETAVECTYNEMDDTNNDDNDDQQISNQLEPFPLARGNRRGYCNCCDCCNDQCRDCGFLLCVALSILFFLVAFILNVIHHFV
jgi:hypothetical protein